MLPINYYSLHNVKYNASRMMKPKFIILSFLAFFVQSVSAYTYEEMLHMLDNAIEHRQEYIEKKKSTINTLRKLIGRSKDSRFELYEELYLQYKSFNTDSSLIYSTLCLEEARRVQNPEFEQRALIYKVECLAITSLYQQAWQTLLPMEGELYPSNKCLYYQTKILLMAWENAFTSIHHDDGDLQKQLVSLRDSIIKYADDPVVIAHERSHIIRYEDKSKSIANAKAVLDTMSLNNQWVRHFAFLVGNNYDDLGVQDSTRYYYALSALSDMRCGILEHAALRSLAVLLYYDGDISRAYTYIKQCMDDADKCNARLRTVELAKDMPEILDTYNHMISNQKRSLVIAIIFLTLLLIAITLLLYGTHRSKHRLGVANQQIMEYQTVLEKNKEQLQDALDDVIQLNKNLKESDRIKGAYVTQYMKQCSESIAKAENFRHMLLKTAFNTNFAKLVEVIKDTKLIEEELSDFYKTFDATFLNLFPSFIKDVNNLLAPDKQVAIAKPGQLTTELRICALIRLGVTDNEEISSFLRHSVKTVYNYRSKFRNRSLGDPAEFEEKLKRIGAISD